VSNAAQVIPNKTIKDTFSNSFIVYEIEKFTPNRMRNYLLNFQQSITNTPLPEVFQSLVQSKYSAEKIDENIDIPLQVREATNSVVKIDGIAESCSAAMTGTGFVVANERVITNAHVVAGVDEPVISQPDSELQLQGKIIFLDRNKDIAVIFVPGLTAEKLTFIGPVTPKEVAFVAGYPNGGGLKKTVVSISTEFESVGSDIDGVGEVKREVIVFGGDIKPGNSGGPILNFEGQVLGMVFAADAVNKNTGYALAPQELIEIINESRNLLEPVDSGQCAKAN
jgi:S1-C subfamily serine protease